MNAFQICSNTSDLVPLYLPQQLYLKPIARLNMSLQLPNVKKLGKSVSHWEIMDKIRSLIKPDEFTVLKVIKTTVEFVRFEGEVETKDKLEQVITKIDNKLIKLKDFSDLMRIRCAEWKSDFPHRQAWDEFFQNSKDMNEMKPGERPDTIHISNLPSKWFVPYHLSGDEDITPSEKIFFRIFEKFGTLRYVDIPICDPYRKKMKDHISGIKNCSFDTMEFFEGYVQFKDYIGFTKAMDALRNMKIVHKEDDTATEVNIKVEFDKTKHLSDASIRRREIVRDRLVKKAREKEEKDKNELEEKKRKEELERQREAELKTQKQLRRKLREEKRKAKILQKLEITGSDEINEKIAREEKKLLKVQRKLEAIRLVEELFKRVKDRYSDNVQVYDNMSNPAHDELSRFKNTSELEVLTQREKLHHAIKGRVMLGNILSGGTKKLKIRSYSSSSSESNLSLDEPVSTPNVNGPLIEKYPELLYDPSWIGYNYQLPPGPVYPEYADSFPQMRGYFHRGRHFPRFPYMPGPSRGGPFNRRRNSYQPRNRGYRGGRNSQYPPELMEEYRKYISKYFNEHDSRIFMDTRRYSRSFSQQHHSRNSRSRSRSSTRRRSYTRSYSRTRSRSSRSRSRSYSGNRRLRSHSYRSSRSRAKSRDTYSRGRSRSRSKSSRRRYSRTKSARSRSRSKDKSQRNRSKSKERSQKSRSKSIEKAKSRRSTSKEKLRNSEKSVPKDRARSREKSVDSSTFLTPQQLSHQISERRRRSRSWSLPKEGQPSKERSWSKSPEKRD